MTIAYILIFLTPIMGAILASFFSAQVMRAENLTKASGPYSVDDQSGERLKWYELIPVISYIGLKGKSRYTGKRIDFRIFLAELMGFLIYLTFAVGSFLQLTDSNLTYVQYILNYIIFFAFLSGLFYLAVYDLFTFSIPANITMYLTLAAVGVNIIIGLVRFFNEDFLNFVQLGNFDNLLAAMIAGAFVLILIYLTKQRGMGEGDVYIAIIMGVMLGTGPGLASFYVTILSATAVGVVLMLWKKKLKGLIVPLVPFMAMGFAAGATLGQQIIDLLFFSFL